MNAGFKDHWHRPRPIQVAEFGGGQTYVQWWNPGGACHRNCSFASGEAAAAAWMIGPAALLPTPWRGVAIGAAAIFAALIGLGRMAAGAHFVTDVIFGVLMTLFAIWLMYGICFRWPWPNVSLTVRALQNRAMVLTTSLIAGVVGRVSKPRTQ